jgi:hypothetical protein
MDDSAPLNQTMNIQLDVWAVDKPNCPETAIWRGTAPKAYHTKAVNPAQMAGALMSRNIFTTLWNAKQIAYCPILMWI